MPDLKLRHPQPHLSREHLRDRVKLAQIYVNLTRTLYETAFPKHAKEFGSDVEKLLVLLCIFIGDAEGRPTTPSKIATHCGLTRQSVYRRIEELMNLGKVVRIGRSYHIAENAVNPDKHGRLTKILNGFSDK